MSTQTMPRAFRSRKMGHGESNAKTKTTVSTVATVTMESRTAQLFGFILDSAPQNGIAKKLTSVEAQRIMAVMDEMLRKSKLMCWVPMLTNHIVMFAPHLHKDIVKNLKEYNAIAKRFEMGEHSVAEDIQSATRNLLRAILNDAPSHDYIQSKLAGEKGDAQAAELHESLEDLKLLLFERLLTTVEQQRARSDHLAMIIDKERKASMEVDRLSDELKEFNRARQEEFNKQQVILSELNAEILEIKAKTQKQEKRILDNRARSKETEKKGFMEEAAHTELEKKALEEKLKTQREQDKAEELALRRRKWKIESEVRAWIAKYDDEMGQKQEELEDLLTIYGDEKHQFSELSKRHADLKVEFDRIEEEKRRQREKLKEHDAKLVLMIKSARLIQAIWRGHRTRRILRQKLKKLQGKKK